MGESELVPRDRALDRQHSLASLDAEPHLVSTLGQPASSVMDCSGSTSSRHGQVELMDPFANMPTTSTSAHSPSRSPSPRPTLAQAIEAHEIFEYSETPEVLSPKSGNSPLMPEPELHGGGWNSS